MSRTPQSSQPQHHILNPCLTALNQKGLSMSDFMPVTASNHPVLKDHEAVEAIIARYWLDQEFSVGVGFDRQTGQPYLFCFGYVWPEAWKVPDGVSPADFYPFEDEVYEDGADGFNQLLQELAPYLVEPLTVQAVGSIKCQFPLSATEWDIEPNGTDVKINEFRHSDTEPADATEAAHV